MRTHRVALCWAVIVAGLPYVALKTLWLFGYTEVGAESAADAAELGGLRHVVGNLATLGLEAILALLAMAMTYSWGRRVPGALVVVPVWLGSGVLAPVALGLPPGVVVQAVAGGSATPEGDGLRDWVYAVVYGGFALQAIGLALVFLGYARERWPAAFRRTSDVAMARPGWRRPVSQISTVLVAGWAVVMCAWSLPGADVGGPAGFETLTQRAFLLATAVAGFAGAAGVLVVLGPDSTIGRSRRPLPGLAAGFVGTGVLVTSGSTHLLLSHGGQTSRTLMLVATVASISGLALAERLRHGVRRATESEAAGSQVTTLHRS